MLTAATMRAFCGDEDEALGASGCVALAGVVENVTRLGEGSRGEE